MLRWLCWLEDLGDRIARRVMCEWVGRHAVVKRHWAAPCGYCVRCGRMFAVGGFR